MKVDEKLFRVSIEPAFTHLVGHDFNEGVVTAFSLDAQAESAEDAGEGARLRGVPLSLHGDALEEFVRLVEDVALRQLCSEKVSHSYFPGAEGSTTAWIQSIFSSGMCGSFSLRNCSPIAQSPVTGKKRRPE